VGQDQTTRRLQAQGEHTAQIVQGNVEHGAPFIDFILAELGLAVASACSCWPSGGLLETELQDHWTSLGREADRLDRCFLLDLHVPYCELLNGVQLRFTLHNLVNTCDKYKS